jgi:NhaP-type Na+/H+ or K+/H+ antiporter
MAKRLLPRSLRRALQIEAGVNDGLALPLVLLAGALATQAGADAVGGWLVDVAREIGLAVGCGLALGLAAGRLVELAIHSGEVEPANLAGLGVALALAVFGITDIVGGSGVLAVFVAALTFSLLLERHVRDQLEEVQEAVAKFFVLPAFVLFGAILPWDGWVALGLPGLVFAAWVILLRRPIAVGLSLPPRLAPLRARMFVGWFGPIGMAAIYYATFAERFGVEGYERVFSAATLTVFCSIVVHTLTATPGVRLYAGRRPFTTLRNPFSDVESSLPHTGAETDSSAAKSGVPHAGLP